MPSTILLAWTVKKPLTGNIMLTVQNFRIDRSNDVVLLLHITLGVVQWSLGIG